MDDEARRMSLTEIEHDPALLQAAQAAWPEMREKELAAGRRLFDAILSGDWPTCMTALAESADARATYLGYYACMHKPVRPLPC